MFDQVQRFSPRIASAMLAFGMAFLVEGLVTIDWSYPYCSGPDSGPAWSVAGMPLPDMVYSGVSSLEYLFMPHVYALNLLLLAIPLYLACQRFFSHRLKFRAGALGAIAVITILLPAVLLSLSIYSRFLIPVSTIADGGFMRYGELRPVSFGLKPGRSGDCIPSPFWFPQGWNPR